MLDKLKERFMNLRTVEGQTYMWLGGGLLLSSMLGLPQYVAAMVPIVGFVMLAAGAWKTFSK